jgi:putative exosortase-associated protein (TIGR04073 family)
MIRTPILLLAVVTGFALLTTGCAKTEQKFSRGMRNVTEFARMGEIRYSYEQTALFDGPDKAYTSGIIKGINKSLVRTGVGVYEIVTAPFPPYEPVLTHYISPEIVYPASYQPGIAADQTMATDTYMGFSGGDVAPMVPGSRFRVFDQ